MKLAGSLKTNNDETMENRKQQNVELEGVSVKNIILDPHYEYMGPKLKTNMKLPYKNLRPLKSKMRKDLQSVLPDLPNQYKKDFSSKAAQIPIEKGKKNSDNYSNFSQNNKKKTFLLNSIIDILQNKQTIIDSDLRQQQKFKKYIRTQPDYLNEFDQLGPITNKNSRGPRLIENNITKLHNNQGIPQRKMFSQEKNRRRESDPSQKRCDSRIRTDLGVELMTFYRPKEIKEKRRKYQDEKNQFLQVEKQQ